MAAGHVTKGVARDSNWMSCQVAGLTVLECYYEPASYELINSCPAKSKNDDFYYKALLKPNILAIIVQHPEACWYHYLSVLVTC